MIRFAASFAVAAILLNSAAPAHAEERSKTVLAPSEAVATAWAKEARERERVEAGRPSSKTIKVLAGSYGVLQGLDMYSTIVARNRGANEVNPIMNTPYAQATVFKAAMTATTLITLKQLEKKNKKAAIAAMVAMNVVSGFVVAKNFSNAQRLK